MALVKALFYRMIFEAAAASKRQSRADENFGDRVPYLGGTKGPGSTQRQRFWPARANCRRAKWTLQRLYMQLEGLQTLSDTAPARLSAVQR
jgi:hypothetical protein